jgi:prepilin-type N-terminal cleavage/methylation domain-containing protein
VREDAGFTIIELLIVVIIVGILVSITVPSFMSLQDRANKGAAMTAVRAASSDIEAFYADNGTFAGISAAVLKSDYDETLDTTSLYVHSTGTNDTSFIACSVSSGWYGYKRGPAEPVDGGPSAPVGCPL